MKYIKDKEKIEQAVVYYGTIIGANSGLEPATEDIYLDMIIKPDNIVETGFAEWFKGVMFAQAVLDATIHKQHNVELKDTMFERSLALKVELAELANEMREFKYWSTKPAGPNVMEEYIDVIHFAASLVNTFAFENFLDVPGVRFDAPASELIYWLLSNELVENPTQWICVLAELGEHIGTLEELDECYNMKAEENYRRSREGY